MPRGQSDMIKVVYGVPLLKPTSKTNAGFDILENLNCWLGEVDHVLPRPVPDTRRFRLSLVEAPHPPDHPYPIPLHHTAAARGGTTL